MKSYLSLTKAFLKSLSMSKIQNRSQRITFKTLLITIFLFIFLPFITVVGAETYYMTTKFQEVGFETIGINFITLILCLFIFAFSINVIINELYFNDNIEHILPLPLKPFQIVASKFTAVYFAENLVCFFIIITGAYGYLSGLAETVNLHISSIQIIMLILGSLLVPLIPMIYCGIICLLIMNFTKFIKNKETIRQLSMIVVFVALFFFAFSISTLQQFDFDLFIKNMALGNHKFINTMNYIFPQVKLYIDFITDGNLLTFILFVLTNIIYIIVFLVLSNYLYFNGVINLSSKNTNTNKFSTKLLDNIKVNTPFKAYFIKELKILYRTPSYLINCLVVNIIWPIFVYVIYKVNSFDLEQIKNLIKNNDQKTLVYLLIYIIVISVLVPAVASIGSSSFSREGKHFSFMKYIPVDYKTQWIVKVLVAFLISFIGVNFYTTIFYIYMNLSLLNVLVLYLISFIIILLVCTISTFIDSIQPKLIWDDELNALRENYNTFMVMGITLVYGTILCIITNKLYKMNININTIYLIIISITIISLLLSILLSNKKGIKNIILQEET